MTGGWNTSRRSQQLPPGWHKIRARILRRDPTCTLTLPGCTDTSTEVHHVANAHDHSDDNLIGACHHCHQQITQAQATAAIRAHHAKRTRPPPPHPGLTG